MSTHSSPGEDTAVEPAVGQIWRHTNDERHGVIRDLRIEAIDDRYVHGRGVQSGRPTRVLRGTGLNTGPRGYHPLPVA